MKKGKVKFTVDKIVKEPKKKGPQLLKVFISCGGKQYTKICREIDYLDDDARLSLHRLWMKGFKELMGEDGKSERKTKADEKLLADMVGSEIEDEEG